MKLLTENKPRDLRLNTLSRKIIQLTTISLLTMSLHASAAENPKTVTFVETYLPLVQKTIKGKVTDEKGNPIPGANIVAKGTKVSAQTDLNGNFTINVPDNANKTCYYFYWYGTTGSKCWKQLRFTIVLKETGQKLDEVIVVGYGKQKKRILPVL